ncbi:hypothetical protein SUDANB43_01667 [Streptomyces sp. enrichment culture]
MSPGGNADAVVLRRAAAADARAAADVWLRSFSAALPTVVRPHSDAEVRAWFRDVVVERYDHLRRWLRSRNIVPRIARKGVEFPARLGRHRWTVERTVSWLSGIRRLHRRYERRPDHFLAFAGIAAVLICYRRLNGTATRP